MKPQDIIVMLKIMLWENTSWSVAKISASIKLSVSETHSAIKRCELSGLYSPITRKPIMKNFEEFILHGIKYVFPVVLGTIDRGIPTAHSAPPLNDIIVNNTEEIYVWPYANGKTRGVTINPLYPTVPVAALNDEKLYKLLALIDSLRIGKSREKIIAEKEIIKRIENYFI